MARTIEEVEAEISSLADARAHEECLACARKFGELIVECRRELAGLRAAHKEVA